MSDKTGIEWTNATWNPIRGCSRVSIGCTNCYAESVAYRFSGVGKPYEGLMRIGADGIRRREWNGQIRFVEKHLLDPLKWKEPRRIFVNSMSDLYHENCPDRWRDPIYAVMAQTPEHTYQILTKRPERRREYLSSEFLEDRIDDAGVQGFGWCHANAQKRLPLPNVWEGVSVENCATKHRIDTLRQTPAALRFLSLEPLLEDLGELDLSGIGWVIVGGESGPGARPCDVDWIRSIVQQCKVANLPVFVKQLGAKPYQGRDAEGVFVPDYEYFLQDRKGGDIEEFPEDLRVREFPLKMWRSLDLSQQCVTP
jgi:protein gp37